MKKVLFLTLGLFLTVATVFSQKKVNGNGNVTKENVRISEFTELHITGAFEIALTQSDQSSLVIEADENLIQYIEVKNSGDRLEIGLEDDLSLNDIESLKLYINVKDLREINVSGAVNLFTENTLTFNHLMLDISGAGKLEMDVKGSNLDCDFSGAASIDLTGSVRNVDFSISGVGKLDSSDMNAENFDLDFSGVGIASIYVTNELRVQISGMGVASVGGNPKKVHQDIGLFGKLEIN